MSRHLDLMRLYDEEATAEERAELEASLTEEDVGVLAGLSQLTDVVRALESVRAVEAVEIDVTDGVLGALEAEAAPANVVPLVPPVEKAPAPSLALRKSGPRSTTVAIAGLALAAAAATAVWLGARPSETTSQAAATAPAGQATSPGTSEPTPEPPVEPVAELADSDADPAAVIEAVDFGSGGGSIFLVPAGEETTPVVWLVDEPAGARMEPL
jgi:hypothetical protein